MGPHNDAFCHKKVVLAKFFCRCLDAEDRMLGFWSILAVCGGYSRANPISRLELTVQPSHLNMSPVFVSIFLVLASILVLAHEICLVKRTDLGTYFSPSTPGSASFIYFK